MAQHIVTLQSKRLIAAGTQLLVFTKPAGYTFVAGQYVALSVPEKAGIVLDARGLARSFSIASAPYEEYLYFSMRHSSSAFKRTCWALVPGDQARVTDAVGTFVTPPLDVDHERVLVFLVGGIGITPVRSILKQAEYDKSPKQFTLLSANRSLGDAAFHEELAGLSLEHFCYVTVLSQSEAPCQATNDERGYICESLIQKYVTDVPGSLYYIVGSPQFIEAMERVLDTLGVPREGRRKDPFTGLQSASAAPLNTGESTPRE